MRERLTDRVRTRLLNKGTPERSADRQAAAAVDNYYNGIEDEHSDLVAAEACREFADHLMNRASRMAEAWEHLGQMMADFEHMKSVFSGAVMSLHVDQQRNARFGLINAGKAAAEGMIKGVQRETEPDFGDDSEPTNAPPSDVITGFEDGCHIVNGDPSSCACPKHLAGHSVRCEVRNAPGWEHSPTLCDVPRTNCSHGETTRHRHTYGQECEGDQIVSPQVYTGHAVDCLTFGGHAGTDCHKLRPTCFHSPRHEYGEVCPK